MLTEGTLEPGLRAPRSRAHACLPPDAPWRARGRVAWHSVSPASTLVLTPAYQPPASGTWPPGVAAGETIIAGDQGGRRAQVLAGGVAIGLLGSIFVVPGAMSAFGVAFIGNVFALTMFGVGLLVNGYSEPLFGIALGDYSVPSGFMIGAGLVALVQVVGIVRNRGGGEEAETVAGATSEVEAGPGITLDERSLSRGLSIGFGLYLVMGVVLAAVGGIFADMPLPQLVLWVAFAAIAAMASELIVGLSAMHAGWFPAFGTALAFLGVGIIIGFPAVPLALLAGYTASTGPAFADMGYDFKAGWLLRRGANSAEFEREGRLQQYLASLVAFGVGLIVVAVSWRSYFSQDLIPRSTSSSPTPSRRPPRGGWGRWDCCSCGPSPARWCSGSAGLLGRWASCLPRGSSSPSPPRAGRCWRAS